MMVYSRLLKEFCRGNSTCQAYSTAYLFLVAAFAAWGVISAVALGFYMMMRYWRRHTRRSRVDPLTRLDAACEEMSYELSRHVDNSQVVKGLECLVNTAPNPADPSDCGYCENECGCEDETAETRSQNPIREALSKPAAAVANQQIKIGELPPCTVQTFACVPTPHPHDDVVVSFGPSKAALAREAAHVMATQEKFARRERKSAEEALANNPLFKLVSKNLEISRCQRMNDELKVQRLTQERDQAVRELPFAPRTQAPVRVNETINELTKLQLQIENTVDKNERAQLRTRRDELRSALRATKKQQLEEDMRTQHDN